MITNWKLMIKGLFIFLSFLSVEMYVPCSLIAGVGDNMSLSADPTSIQADGLSTTKIKAVVDHNGTLLSGVTLTFETTQGFFQDSTTGLLDKKSIVTYSDTVGASTVVLYSATTPGTATIKCVASGTYTNPSPPPQTIAFGPVTRIVDVYFTGVPSSIVLSADPTTVLADNLKYSTITAKLYDKYGVQIEKPGILVDFTISAGGVGHFSNSPTSTTITASTDATGAATALVYSAVSGTADISANCGAVPSNHVYVNFTGGATVSTIVLSADPTSVPADNLTPSTITAKLYDQNRVQIVKPGIPVDFTISGSGVGHFSNSPTSTTITASTDATGAATALVYSAVSGTADISANSGAVPSNHVYVNFTGGATTIVLSADPTSVPADNLTPSTITAKVYDQYGKQITNPGMPVFFTIASGVARFSNDSPKEIIVSTDATGTATTPLYSSVVGKPGIRAVITTGGITTVISEIIYINFTAPTLIIVLSADPTSVPADNLTPSTITAKVYDQYGKQITNPGMPVYFTIASGVARFSNDSPKEIIVSTDATGTATTPLYSSVVGKPGVRASITIGSSTAATSEIVYINFTVPTSIIVLSADPMSVPADNLEYSTITAKLYDQNGVQIVKPGILVDFSISADGVGHFPNGSPKITVSTDATGTAAALLYSSVVGIAGISATANGITCNSIFVIFTAPPQTTVLSVNPTNQDVAKDAGTTTFSVSNTGTETMLWTAAVTSGGSWLSITSGASGSNSGTITCKFIGGTSTTARTGTIRVTATGAAGSPQDVTVTQAGRTQPVLSVSPVSQDVAKDTVTATFGISNTGTGTMSWTAAVTLGGSWLAISGTSGTDTGTITCSFTANTSSSARTATIRVIAVGATDTPQDVTVTQAGSTQPVLSVSPVSLDVVKGAGTATFSVSNTGTGTMPWIAQMTSGSSWLRIQSGASGSDAGTITCAFDANAGTSARTGIILVTAVGATGSPKDVTVTQAGSLSGSLAASFGDLGLFVYNLDSAMWTQISSANPENMIYSGSTLYADFGASYGLCKWDGAAWSQLTTANPENMVASGSMLYVDFGTTYGLWRWDGAVWAQLTTANPENMVASSGSMLYVDFGVTYGLCRWDGAAWTQLSPDNPENMVASGSTLYADFGVQGIRKWDGAAWSQLTSANPENMVASGSTLYAGFGAYYVLPFDIIPSYGLCRWDGAAWTQLSPGNPENMVISGSTLYVDFGASYGLWRWDSTAWAQLSPDNPENMVASGSTLYVDFGVQGILKWDSAAWSQLTGSNPVIMAISN